MADEKLGGAYFEISGRNNAGSAINSLNSQFASLERIVAQNWWGVKNLALAFAALPAAVAAGTAVAINYARSWEDALYDVSRTSELVGAALDEIESDLFRIARATPIATAELAALASEGAALGIAASDLGEFARVMGLTVASTDLTSDGIENVARVLNIMQVPSEDFEAFASALIDVGRSTAATESDIITAAKRLSTVGAVAGASQEQILAMSAALRSLGPEAEAGATAINKTILDMGKAIGTGAEELEHYARISGLSIEQFSEVFRGNAYDALQFFLKGLAELPEDLASLSTAFEQTGVDGSRQAAALATIVNGMRDAGNEQRDYNAILERTSKAREENSVLSDLEAKKLNTLSGQLEILSNITFEAGAVFGALLLPAVKQSVGVLQTFGNAIGDLGRGFSLIDPVFRGFISVVAVGTFTLLAFAAAVLLIAPRVVIAVGAMRQLQAATTQTAQASRDLAVAEDGKAAATNRATAAAQKQKVVYSGVRNELGQLVSIQVAETAATQAGTVADVQATTAVQRLRVAYAGLSVSVKRAGAAIAGVAVSMALLGYLTAQEGKAQREAEKARQDNIKAMSGQFAKLVDLNDEQGHGIRALETSAKKTLMASESYAEMSKVAAELGYDMRVLNDIITGKGSESASAEAISGIADAAESGNKSAKVLFNTLKDLYESYGSVRDATKDSVEELAKFTQEAQDATGATQELADALESQAKAHVDYIGALFSQRDAQLSLRDAERELREAQVRSTDQTSETEKAELKLAKARLDHDKSLSQLREAEQDLNSARERGLSDLADAEDNLADTRDRYLDNLDKVAKLEEEIAKLRSGPSTDELISATNELRNAQLRLLDANRKVSDAEWYLQYIREQGGSVRDLEDAEFELAKARQDSANEQESVNEAEKELADLRDTAARQKEIVSLERDLLSARRDNSEILRNIKTSERELAEIRRRVAGDEFYKDAQADLVDAQLGVRDALGEIQDAELDLQSIRSGSMSDDLIQAQLDYEQALYNVAASNTEVRRQTALMNGETWDAGDAARTLSEELLAISRNTPDEKARRRIQDFYDIVSRAPDIPDVAQDISDSLTEGFEDDALIDGIQSSIEDAFTEAGLGAINSTLGAPSFWLSMLPAIGLAISPLLTSVGTAIIAGIQAALGVSAAAAGAIFAAGLVLILGIAFYIFNEDFRHKVNDTFQKANTWFREGAESIRDGFLKGIQTLASIDLVKLFKDYIVNPLLRWLGIKSPSTMFEGFGKDIIQGLWNGVTKKLYELFSGFVGLVRRYIVDPIGDATAWLSGKGYDIILGLWNGVVNGFNLIFGPLFKPFGYIKSFFTGAIDWLKNVGRDIIQGLWNGISSKWNEMTGWINDAASHLPGWIKGPLGMNSPSKVFAQMGGWIMEGLDNGLQRGLTDVVSTLKETADAADIQKYIKQNNLEYMLSADGLAGSGAAARLAANSAGMTTTANYGDTVTIYAETNADPEEIVNEYVWQKRVRLRG